MAGHPDIQQLITSQDGIDLIKDFEKLRLRAYQDVPGGTWTIGYGHIDGVEPGDRCTPEEAEDWLKLDLAETENYVKGVVQVPLGQHQFDALVSLTFNMGIGNLMKSDVLRMLNRGNYAGAMRQFARHNTAKGKVERGLIRRRAAEMALFNLPDEAVADKSPVSPPLPPESVGIKPDGTSDATPTPLKDMIMHSRTVQTLLAAFVSLVATVAQLLAPLKENPTAAIVLGLALGGIGFALIRKYYDTKRGT